ncbi:MAG: hypothetical protein AAGD01_20730, partial [Acidobacteriota bacterium]
SRTWSGVGGSTRTPPGVEVEAVSVRCAETCYVQGNLTAWKVKAKSLHLEDTAKAHIVLQETTSLDVGKAARLVGNFGSEKELFFLFSRFSKQVKALPFGAGEESGEEASEAVLSLAAASDDPQEITEAEIVAESSEDAADSDEVQDGEGGELPADLLTGAAMDLPDPLYFALVLIGRDGRRSARNAEEKRVLDELSRLLREGEVEALQSTYRTLFERLSEPGDHVVRARELLQGFFARSAQRAGGRRKEKGEQAAAGEKKGSAEASVPAAEGAPDEGADAATQ